MSVSFESRHPFCLTTSDFYKYCLHLSDDFTDVRFTFFGTYAEYPDVNQDFSISFDGHKITEAVTSFYELIPIEMYDSYEEFREEDTYGEGVSEELYDSEDTD